MLLSAKPEAARDHLAVLANVLHQVASEPIPQAVELLLRARASGRRVYAMGNGGSAATASHLINDLTKTCRVPGYAPLRAFALHDNVACLTAWANDAGYDSVFAEQLATLCEPGDVVIAISASGNSPNIINGLIAGAECGASTIALVGFDGGRAKQLADVVIHVDARSYGLVEDAHSAIGHALTAAVRQALESCSER
jgi:D-sedoheptulose 7-phosphate isomerase